MLGENSHIGIVSKNLQLHDISLDYRYSHHITARARAVDDEARAHPSLNANLLALFTHSHLAE